MRRIFGHREPARSNYIRSRSIGIGSPSTSLERRSRSCILTIFLINWMKKTCKEQEEISNMIFDVIGVPMLIFKFVAAASGVYNKKYYALTATCQSREPFMTFFSIRVGIKFEPVLSAFTINLHLAYNFDALSPIF